MLSLSVICLIKPSHLKLWLNMLSISTSLVSLNWQHDGSTWFLFLHSYCWLQSKKSFCLKLSLLIKVSARGSLLLRDRYFTVIHGISKGRCYVYMCILHMPYSQFTLSPVPVCLQYDFSPDNNGSKCWPKSESCDHFHMKWSHSQLPRVNGWTQTPNQVQALSEWKERIMDLVIIHLLLLRTEVKHFKKECQN